ncbi:MAG: PDZ domain-containing protein [Gemmatimonadota bacterium]
MTVSVELGETELPTRTAVADAVRPVATRMGLRLGPLTADVRSELGYDAAVQGPVVMEVVPLSPAHQKGIRPGTVILEVDGGPVSSATEVAERLDRLEPGSVTGLLVLTPGGQGSLVTLRIPR